MFNARDSKSVLLRFSQEEYESLNWLAHKIGLGVSETLRGLIPRYPCPDGKIVSRKDVPNANPVDSIRLTRSFNKEKLQALLEKLRRAGYAVTLYRELYTQLIEEESPYLSVVCYKRMSRWANPHRWTKRERTVKKIVDEIIKELFGGPFGRIN